MGVLPRENFAWGGGKILGKSPLSLWQGKKRAAPYKYSICLCSLFIIKTRRKFLVHCMHHSWQKNWVESKIIDFSVCIIAIDEVTEIEELYFLEAKPEIYTPLETQLTNLSVCCVGNFDTQLTPVIKLMSETPAWITPVVYTRRSVFFCL